LEQIVRYYGGILNVYAERDQVVRLTMYYGPSGIEVLSFEFLMSVANNSVRASLVLSELAGIFKKPDEEEDLFRFATLLSEECRLPLAVFRSRVCRSYPGLAGA
jgi:hypothetical protein